MVLLPDRNNTAIPLHHRFLYRSYGSQIKLEELLPQNVMGWGGMFVIYPLKSIYRFGNIEILNNQLKLALFLNGDILIKNDQPDLPNFLFLWF